MASIRVHFLEVRPFHEAGRRAASFTVTRTPMVGQTGSNESFVVNARSVLIVSLGLNLVLGTWVVAKLRRAPAGVVALPAAEGTVARSLPIWSLKKTNVIEVITNRVDAPRFHWSSLETNDFEAYVANLRGFGCPEHTVRHLVMGEIEALYAERVVAAEQPGSFWETPRQQRARELRMHREQAALEEEKRAIIRRLFRVDWSLKAEREWVTDETACFLIGFLPDEKAIHLVDTIMRLEKVMRLFQEETDRIVIDTDEPRIEAILAEAKRQLEFGLSPLEVQEGTLRGVNLAQSFMERNGLVGVSLTGDELRRITAIGSRGKDFVVLALLRELYGDLHGEENDIEDIVRQVSPEAQREIHAMLGEQRSAAYERSKDEAFREFAGIASGLDLPLESTVKAYEIRRAAEAALIQLNSNTEMSAEQRRAALDTMRRETEQAITAAVGAPAAKAFFNPDRGWARNNFGARGARR